jgi:exonuclease SbcC
MVSEINAFILDWMAISKKDLQNYFIINGENSKPLFKASNTENIELIGRFSNANLIDGVDKLVVEDCAEIEGRITQLNLSRSEFMGKITAYEEEIEKAKAVDFEQEKEVKIELQKEKIKDLEESINSTKDDNDSIDLSLEKDKEKMCVADMEASELQDKIDDLKKVTFDEKYEKLDKSIESLDEELGFRNGSKVAINKELKEATQMLTEINNNIAGSVKCPKCNHEFLVADPEIDIESEKEDKPKVEKAITSLNDKIKKIETSVEEIYVEIEKKSKEKGVIRKEEQAHLDSIKALRSKMNEFKEEVDNISSTIKRNENKKVSNLSKIESLKESIKLCREQITALKALKKDETIIQRFEDSITETYKEIVKIDNKIKKENDLLFEKKQWVFNFKKFSAHLANKSLKVIQGYCNLYLQEMGSDIQIRIEGYKQKSDGSLSEKITPYIIRNGEVRKYGSFSKGERGRVNLASSLAIVSIINKTHKYGGLENFMADELFEGVDSKGLSLIVKSVEKLNVPMMLTTHVTDRSVSSNVLLVRKENNVSKLIY